MCELNKMRGIMQFSTDTGGNKFYKKYKNMLEAYSSLRYMALLIITTYCTLRLHYSFDEI